MHMTKAQWAWSYAGPKGQFQGAVEAVDPRDALSRALTTATPSGLLFGQEHGIPVDGLRDAPGNGDTQYDLVGDGFTLRVRKVVCPSEARHPKDVVGCGSTNVSGPDEEGIFDCLDCGMFFNPHTAC